MEDQEKDKERARRLQSEGGKKAHALGTAHVFTSEEARVAGEKGGRVRAERRRAETEYIESLIPREKI